MNKGRMMRRHIVSTVFLTLLVSMAFSDTSILRNTQNEVQYLQENFSTPSSLFQLSDNFNTWETGSAKQSFRCFDSGYSMASRLTENDGRATLYWSDVFAKGTLRVDTFAAMNDQVDIFIDDTLVEHDFLGKVTVPFEQGTHSIRLELNYGIRLNWFEITYIEFIAEHLDLNQNGFLDSWESDYGIELPNIGVDSDGDGLDDECEYFYGSNPKVSDSDGDGMLDAYETSNGLRANFPDADLDEDRDGLSNLDEYLTGTYADFSDSDFDRLSDSDEVLIHFTDPQSIDSDKDGLNDFDEIEKWGTNPLSVDTDGDTVSDFEEIQKGTDPLVDERQTTNPELDADSLTTGNETDLAESDWLETDEANDGTDNTEQHNSLEVSNNHAGSASNFTAVLVFLILAVRKKRS